MQYLLQRIPEDLSPLRETLVKDEEARKRIEGEKTAPQYAALIERREDMEAMVASVDRTGNPEEAMQELFMFANEILRDMSDDYIVKKIDIKLKAEPVKTLGARYLCSLKVIHDESSKIIAQLQDSDSKTLLGVNDLIETWLEDRLMIVENLDDIVVEYPTFAHRSICTLSDEFPGLHSKLKATLERVADSQRSDFKRAVNETLSNYKKALQKHGENEYDKCTTAGGEELQHLKTTDRRKWCQEYQQAAYDWDECLGQLSASAPAPPPTDGSGHADQDDGYRRMGQAAKQFARVAGIVALGI